MSLAVGRTAPGARWVMRPGLWVALMAAAGLAGGALWVDLAPVMQPPADARGASQGHAAVVSASGPATLASTGTMPIRPMPAIQPGSAALPAALDMAQLDPAEHDPFVTARPAPVRPLPSPAPVALPAAPLPGPIALPAPMAPPLNYRFLAHITGPAGEVLTFLARGDQAIAVHAGLRLDEGYVVEAVDALAVHLHHPQRDVRAVIGIAPASAATTSRGAR